MGIWKNSIMNPIEVLSKNTGLLKKEKIFYNKMAVST